VDSQALSEPGNSVCGCNAIALTLTPVQWKIIDGVRSGQINKQIAYELGIAEATVKAHMTTIMRKMNVRNRTQVALAAQALRPRLSA
jgi:Response regulator containing a CheY-like receiver domain and an HTH DNA-binding domain